MAILGILMLTGCGDDDKMLGTLSSPTNIQAVQDSERSLIIFDGVENAQYYEIYINDMSVTVRGIGQSKIQFDASKIITIPQKYTIRVKACAEQYFDSELGELQNGYTYTSVLAAPVVTLDGNNLNWEKIQSANFYDVEVVSQNPTTTNVFRVPTNTFDASSVMGNIGRYTFRVKAISENIDYLDSGYSNAITITKTETLVTPYNLTVNYNSTLGEDILTFVSSENVDEFVINVDNQQLKVKSNSNYIVKSLDTGEVCKTDIANMYAIKLNSMLRGSGVEAGVGRPINLSVRAISTTEYVSNSGFSGSISYQYFEVLKSPSISVTEADGWVDISITDNSNSAYLSGYAIYLNEEKFRTLTSDITNITLPTSEIGSKGIRVQAISNNNNCYSSVLSRVAYAITPTNSFNSLGVVLTDGVLSWTDVSASAYFVEISNARYCQKISTSGTSVDMSSFPSGKYSLTITAMGDGYVQRQVTSQIALLSQLGEVTGVDVTTIAGEPYLQFNAVSGAYGYVIYRGNTMVNKIFTSTSICLTEYLAVASDLNISIRAVTALGDMSKDGNKTAPFVWQNITILPDPVLSIVEEGGKSYLKIDVDENYAALSSGLSVWIDYSLLGGEQSREYADTKIDITSYLAVAGKHEFMVKAVSNNDKTRDSRLKSISKLCHQQLNVVTGISVTQNEDEDYILTFNEQTLAAEYQVRIEKADAQADAKEFPIPSSGATITEYIRGSGMYKIYVKAIAIPGSYYIDSATSGNPYTLTKGLTLPSVSNLSIEKKNGDVVASWDSVENCTGYKVNVYYVSGGQSQLLKSVETMPNTISLGKDKYKCVWREGEYTIEVKPLGDGKAYETGKYTIYTYQYKMESEADFKRNTISTLGTTQDYYIDTLDDLKYLLWHHYLYNNQVWNYNQLLTYNLKVYCTQDLDQLAEGCGENIATQVAEITTENSGDKANQNKMNIIATYLLEQYPFLSHYTLGLKSGGTTTQEFCLNEQEGVYMFRYTDELDADKQSGSCTAVKFLSKIDEVEPFYQRAENYIFALDTALTVMDVTTTEQLYLAAQYGARPNFVGDCEVAKTVYENARKILTQICDDGMTPYKKTLQIFDYLNSRVKYNNATVDKTAEASRRIADGNMADNYLEGVFLDLDNQQATSLGLSKAFVLLCTLEGIDAIMVQGTITDASGSRATSGQVTPTKVHFWNKVNLNIENDGYAWYAVDIASSKLGVTFTNNSKTYQTGSHKYFLVTDTYLNTNLGSQPTFTHKPNAETDYTASEEMDYYSYQKYSIKYGNATGGYLYDVDANFKYMAENGGIDQQVKNLIMYAMLRANNRQYVTVDMDISEYVGVGDTTSLLNNINLYYAEIRGKLNGAYNCNLAVCLQGNTLVMCFIPTAM